MRRLYAIVLALIMCFGFVSAQADEYEPLQNGSKGDAVKLLQQALIDQGFLTGSADGIFGNGTAGAVSKFQESVGLEVTGIADNETQRYLFGDAELDDIEVTFTGTFESNRMRVDGLFVDDSYVDDEGSSNAMLYFFYTLFTDAENYTNNCEYLTVEINGVNSYKSMHSKGLCDYMRSYTYGLDTVSVNFGDEIKVVETFEIPSAELNPGRSLDFAGGSNIGMNTISLMTDDIIHLKSSEVIAKFIDPEGYVEAKERFSPADAELQKKVRKELKDYYYEFWSSLGDINNTSITGRFEFQNSEYTLTTSLVGKTYGTYEILNNYIKITNGNTGAVNYLEYEFKENGRLDLDCASIFDYETYRN